MSNELLKYVGSQIKMFRKIKKLTIDDLAKMIGKSKSTVSKYESGEIAIDIATLYDIASALNTSMVILTDYQ
ncbi:MAG TPA: XRE family transcriptional regulator, partial [Clostridiales bacterium]|nr:XRE family transcriptional regulator [Clostridiales bacterium]